MGYDTTLTDSLLARKIGPFHREQRREKKTHPLSQLRQLAQWWSQWLLVPALSSYGVSQRDIPKQVAHNSKQQRQQQVSDFLSSGFLFFSANRQRICPNLLPTSLGIRIWNVTRKKRKTKERAGAQEKLAVPIADTRVPLKHFFSNSKARQKIESRRGNLEQPLVAVRSASSPFNPIPYPIRVYGPLVLVIADAAGYNGILSGLFAKSLPHINAHIWISGMILNHDK